MKIFILDDSEERIDIYKKIYHDCELVITRTADEAIVALEREKDFTFITLDHDLGGKTYCPSDEKSGYWVAKYISEDKNFNCPIVIHTWNPIGAYNMANILPKAIRIPFSTARLV